MRGKGGDAPGVYRQGYRTFYQQAAQASGVASDRGAPCFSIFDMYETPSATALVALKSDLIVGKVLLSVGFNSPPLPDSVVADASFIFIVIIADREAPQRKRWQS
jgi:hypothetical protein